MRLSHLYSALEIFQHTSWYMIVPPNYLPTPKPRIPQAQAAESGVLSLTFRNLPLNLYLYPDAFSLIYPMSLCDFALPPQEIETTLLNPS